MPFAGWSPVGIAALLAIAAGIVLLVVYAVTRGLVHRELEGIEAPAEPGATPVAPTAPRPARTLGLAGAVLLVAGLALGAVAAAGVWTSSDTSGTGLPPADCAQTWQGCPNSTIAP
jgi:hypothetical protein